MTRKENAVRNQGRTPVTGSGELRAVEDTRFGSVSAYSPWLERGSRLSSCCVERIGSRNLSQSSNCGANEWAPTLLATTRIHDANQDPDQQRRSLNGGFSLYRIAARILCLRRPHPEPAASRVRVERISVPLHVPSSARITNEVINAAWWYLLHSVGPQPAAWLAGIRIPRPQMQAFRESTGLPPVAFCLDRVYPNGTGSNGAWYASSPDAAWSETAWDGEDRERPKVSVSPAKLTTFFLGPFFSSCARISGLGTLANPRGIGHYQIQMNVESTVDRTRFLVRSCSRSGDALRRAWSVETGISRLPSMSWMWFS